MAALALALLLLAQEDREPSQIFTLEVGGKARPIELDKPVELDGTGKLSVTLRLAPYRVFRHAGLSFQYPQEYSFEADLKEPGVSNWNLSGNDHKVMVFRYQGRKDHEALLQELQKEVTGAYGAENVKSGETEVALGKRTLKGRRLDIKLVGTALSQRLFSFRAGADSLLLILQDSPAENGRATSEAARCEAFLKDSFRFPD